MLILPRFDREISLKKVFISFFRKYKLSEDILLFKSASDALTFYLSILGTEKNVGVPIYSCSSIAQSIVSSNNKVSYIDFCLNENGYVYNKDQFNKVQVLILIHYFGTIIDVEVLKNEFPHLTIIEDCTHLKMLNPSERCDNVKVYSFNLHKPYHLGIGGLLCGCNKNTVVPVYNNLLRLSYVVFFTLLFKKYIKEMFYNRVVYLFISRFVKKYRNSNSIIVDNSKIVPLKIVGRLSSIVLNSLNSYNYTHVITNYMSVNKEYRIDACLNESEIIYFPIFFKNEFQKKAINNYFKDKVDVYMLWENYYYNANHFDGSIEFSDYKLTKKMVDTTLFFPACFFNNLNNVDCLNRKFNEYTIN